MNVGVHNGWSFNAQGSPGKDRCQRNVRNRFRLSIIVGIGLVVLFAGSVVAATVHLPIRFLGDIDRASLYEEAQRHPDGWSGVALDYTLETAFVSTALSPGSPVRTVIFTPMTPEFLWIQSSANQDGPYTDEMFGAMNFYPSSLLFAVSLNAPGVQLRVDDLEFVFTDSTGHTVQAEIISEDPLFVSPSSGLTMMNMLVELPNNPDTISSFSIQLSHRDFLGQVVAAWSLDDSIYFADPQLEAAVRDVIGRRTGRITREDAGRIQVLKATHRGIRSLDGIESLANLENLKLDSNSITDVSPLSSLHSLEQLGMSNNPVTDIRPLSTLRQLTVLDVSNGKLKDLSGLAYLDNLHTLDVSGNDVASISPLRWLTNLRQLVLADNNISDLEPLAALTDLIFLNIEDNPVMDLSPLQSLLDENTVIKLQLSNARGNGDGTAREGAAGEGTAGEGTAEGESAVDIRAEYRVGEFTIRIVDTQEFSQYVEISKGGQVVYVRDGWRFWLVESFVQDITGDGFLNLPVLEWSGGAHCCNTIHVIDLEP